MQTNLGSDSLCSYNQEASPYYWIFQNGQYQNNYTTGEIGVFSAGGVGGSFTPTSLIDISSFLDGRTNILSKCTPPIPALSDINQPKMNVQGGGSYSTNQTENFNNIRNRKENFSNIRNRKENFTSQPDTSQPDSSAINTYGLKDPATILISKYTKEKHSANELSAIDYNRWQPLYFEQQTPRYVIEDLAAERGGLNTSNYTKSAWNNQNQIEGFDKNQCMTVLDPQRDCGPDCSLITGYPGVNPFTGQIKSAVFKPSGKPQGQPDYPFTDITSQQVFAVGSQACGDQFFYSKDFNKGSCPPIKQTVMLDNKQFSNNF